MKRNYFKDLKWHIIFLIVSLFFICKYSSAPPIFDALNVIFQKPEENTIIYEVIRIAENLSLAYIASLVFYLLVDYIPSVKEENNTISLLEKYLNPLYMYIDKVNSYFKYATGVSAAAFPALAIAARCIPSGAAPAGKKTRRWMRRRTSASS